MKLKKPYFWDDKELNLISILFFQLTIFLFLINLFSFKNNNKIEKIKTICVGNIYVGGTGKTPLTIFIAKELAKRGKNPAIIRKYYKNKSQNPLIFSREVHYKYFLPMLI